MPRRSLGARLYLDPKRKQWSIREGTRFIRLGLHEDLCEQAEAALASYMKTKSPRAEGLVYFLTAAHSAYPIKIGFTKSFEALRMRSLQGACPYALYFIGHHEGTMQDEHKLHSRFDRLRLRGEWFQRDEQLLIYIKATCSNVAELVA